MDNFYSYTLQKWFLFYIDVTRAVLNQISFLHKIGCNNMNTSDLKMFNFEPIFAAVVHVTLLQV